MAQYKICSKCGARVLFDNADCSNRCKAKAKRSKDKEYDRTRRKNKDIYNNGRWKRLTEQCKRKFKGLDIYLLYTKREIAYGNLSHHIVTIEDDKDKAYDITNLIYLSDKSHRLIHKAYIRSKKDKEDMQQLLLRLIKLWEDKCIDIHDSN